MSNKEIARLFDELAKLMELHEENTFKIRSYQNAYINLRKVGPSLLEMSEEEINRIKGVGKAIAGKIAEIGESGTFATLERFRNLTPDGIRELLRIKGFGPKKIKLVWEGLDITSPGELYYACNENRLVELKGFGEKTQTQLKAQLEYYFKNRNNFLFATLEPYANELLDILKGMAGQVDFKFTGAYRRLLPVLDTVEVLGIYEGTLDINPEHDRIEWIDQTDDFWKGKLDESIPFKVYFRQITSAGKSMFLLTGPESFTTEIDLNGANAQSEKTLLGNLNLDFIVPELRDHPEATNWAKNGNAPELVELKDLKGMVHNHSTYSDGIDSLEDMVSYTRELGYEYLVISDHSKSAFYANGLQIERVEDQWAEIDRINAKEDSFRLIKGIESDILNDGNLDYPDDILSGFEVIIASVHSNLRMDLEKATQRLITAIENPFTSILGHPTGRLLLSREGYPIDHMKVIDACAANGVSIEINANPYRLDLDWTWIPYALERGVLISINPDAHSKEGMKDVRFGLMAARKGGLTAEFCLNAKDVDTFLRLT